MSEIPKSVMNFGKFGKFTVTSLREALDIYQKKQAERAAMGPGFGGARDMPTCTITGGYFISPNGALWQGKPGDAAARRIKDFDAPSMFLERING